MISTLIPGFRSMHAQKKKIKERKMTFQHVLGLTYAKVLGPLMSDTELFVSVRERDWIKKES